MGIERKMKWATKEEEALRTGVAKYGEGRWKTILEDPMLSPSLSHRTNVDLKDKWRNIMKDRTKTSTSDLPINEENQGPAALADDADENVISPQETEAASADNADESIVSPQETEAALADNADKSVVSPHETKATPPYKTWILKAILSTKDPKGSEISAIVEFIEQQHAVPQDFMRSLRSQLRDLVSQGLLEKVNHCYRIKIKEEMATETPKPKKQGKRPRLLQNQNLVISANEALAEAGKTVARESVDSETKSLVAEDVGVLRVVKDIYGRCKRAITWAPFGSPSSTEY